MHFQQSPLLVYGVSLSPLPEQVREFIQQYFCPLQFFAAFSKEARGGHARQLISSVLMDLGLTKYCHSGATMPWCCLDASSVL